MSLSALRAWSRASSAVTVRNESRTGSINAMRWSSASTSSTGDTSRALSMREAAAIVSGRSVVIVQPWRTAVLSGCPAWMRDAFYAAGSGVYNRSTGAGLSQLPDAGTLARAPASHVRIDCAASRRRRRGMSIPELSRIASRLWVVAGLLASGALAQTYPSKPIRVIDGFPAGGSTDIVARIVGPKFQESQGQPWIVDNRPGAQGIIGGELAAKSPPDGYTLLMFTGTFTVHPSIYRNLPFDITKSFVGVIQTSTITNVLAMHPSVPARNVKELIALAKTKPGRLNFAGGGTGPQLTGERFNNMAGLEMTYIHYMGGGPAVTATVGGETDLVFATMPTAIPFIRSGRLRALGVCTATRTSLLPDLPTIAEAGLPGYEATNSVGVVAPAGTPREIVAKLQQEIARILSMRDVQERLLAAGIEPSSMKPEQFNDYIRAEVAKWAKVVKAAGIEQQTW